MKKFLYIAVLLYFNFIIISSVFANGSIDNHQSGNLFNFSNVIAPLGIITLICLITTFTLGLLMSKNRKVLFPWHKRISFTTLILALMHGTMVLIFH